MENPLINFGIDLTQKAKDGKLDKVWGRDDELLRASQILSRRKKNNLLLVGHPGSGKTAIAEAIAQKIVSKDISFTLHDKTIFNLDLGSIIAGTQFRGQMEERLKNIIDYLSKNKNIILFIDEIHTIMDSGSSSNSLNMANIFKPYLSNGGVQVIGATTHDECKKYFEKDAAMARRFQNLIVEDPSPETTVKILENCKESYEKYHSVFYPMEVVEKIPGLAYRYLTDRHLPDSAIDILDEVGARASIETSEVPEGISKIESELNELNEKKIELVKVENWKEIVVLKKELKKIETKLSTALTKWESKKDAKVITEDEVLKVISSISKIPLDQLKEMGKDKIGILTKGLDENLIGQEEAKAKIIKALKRNILGISSPNKPIASFLFLGKTGVGKTEFAKILADTWFNGEMIRLDMSEFMEKINATQLTGAPPGYVGYESGGKLTEQVRRKPYSLILLDEIEKAHPDIINNLLQILDEGHLTDGLGKTVNFKNTVIIMTSNLGAKETAVKKVGFGATEHKLQDKSLESAKKYFAPEIWNRIDEVVVFEELSKEHMAEILKLEVAKVQNLLKYRNIKLTVDKKAEAYILDKGYSDEYGARFMKRTIQTEITDPLAEYLLIKDSNNVTIKCSIDSDGKVTFKQK